MNSKTIEIEQGRVCEVNSMIMEPHLHADQTEWGHWRQSWKENSSGCMNSVIKGTAHKNPSNLEFFYRRFRKYANRRKWNDICANSLTCCRWTNALKRKGPCFRWDQESCGKITTQHTSSGRRKSAQSSWKGSRAWNSTQRIQESLAF